MEGSSSSNYENPYPYPYPYPSHVTMKLSSRDTYDVWKTQMLCLLKSLDMLRFIELETLDGYNQDPWRSDELVKGWILGSLSKQTLKYVVNSFPNTDFTAKDAWDKLQTIYGPPMRAGRMMHLFSHVPVTFKFVEATQRKAKAYSDAILLLLFTCNLISTSTNYNNAIFEATRQNAVEFVKIIVSRFPNAIWTSNEDGHNIIQHAVINRSEKVYNLLYQMSEHKNIYRTIKDPFKNNLLHLVARLAPEKKLNPISGAALQIQRELQWFKEVERFVCPLNVIQKNSFGETPQMVFTKEHKKLLIEGQKWMKETAQSYTITATLITTIMFAAAITVPGGNKQDNGIPMFTNISLFTLFAVSDVISFFTSVASLLMFLSIVTDSFTEQDFLFWLPSKLIIGLVSLSISTIAMLVAFSASFVLVFGQNSSWIFAPVVTLIVLPFTFFMTLQFALVKNLTSATYGRSMFGKKSDDPFY
ncbi:hypothetical protein R6Q59_016223 [Mikania micrantha]